MHLDNLLAEIESYVENMYQDHPDHRLLYHNIHHIRDVVSGVITICGQCSLDEKSCFPIIAAAWFHDTGYLFSGPENHEQVSAVKASEYLEGRGVDAEVINKVTDCIMATKVPQQPKDLQGQIICDADLFHFGKPGFLEKSKMLKKETELFTGKELNGSQWRDVTIGFMTGHTYFTDFALRELAPQKEKYLEELRTKQGKKKAEKSSPETGAKAEISESQEDKPSKKKKKKNKADKDELPTRGVETLFRLTSKNHMEMSSMADSKAGIMISVNSIIISVVLSVLMRRLEDYPHLVIPTVILLLVNISTIIFAVLATRPKILGGQFTQEDIDNRKINLLFFGHFHRMSLEAYQDGIRQMLADKEYLYSSLVKDIYYLGVVLGRKYKFLRISYTIFMYGLIIAVATFGFAIWFIQY